MLNINKNKQDDVIIFELEGRLDTVSAPALQDAVDEAMYTNDVHAKSIEGNRNSTWILMDYEDVIVHLFSQEDRLFYNLECLDYALYIVLRLQRPKT